MGYDGEGELCKLNECGFFLKLNLSALSIYPNLVILV
jgi:hypothetical protein